MNQLQSERISTQATKARILFVRPDGRPVYEIRGGSVDQQPDDLPDLLGDPQGGDEPVGDPTGEPDPATGEAPPAWWAQASTSLRSEINSEIDRRIGQLTRRQQQGQPNGQQNGQQQGNQQPAAPQGLDPADIRETRSVARDLLRDSIKLSPEEQQLAATLTPIFIRAELQANPDPDQAGSQVAAKVANQIRGLRTYYQKTLIRQLETTGALDRSKLRTGTPNTPQIPGAGAPGSDAQKFASAADKARQMQQARGNVVPGSKTT